MSTPGVRACVRCHGKKVRCSGYPGCQSCRDAGIRCQPYTRRKKADTLLALRESEDRVKWLQSELSRSLGVDCNQLPTGTDLQALRRDGSSSIVGSAATQTARITEGDQGSPNSASSRQARDDGPHISQVTLNATGEQKYLGPSSGALFASHAAAILRSYTRDPPNPSQRTVRRRGKGKSDERGQSVDDVIEDQHPIPAEMVKLLHQSYIMWIHPLYLIFTLETLEGIIRECAVQQSVVLADMAHSPERAGKMAIFYLIMALGSTNHDNTVTQLRRNNDISASSDGTRGIPTEAPSPASLYSKALPYFDILAQDLCPNLTTIQILLLVCIYSSYGPIGSSQWQLAGLAMRLAVETGLHSSSKDFATSPELVNERNSIFWTAYAIEISLSYNLGRPPSIGEEHITAELPIQTQTTSLGILHVKHRQIQGRIVSKVYGGAVRTDEISIEARRELIVKLQSQLDTWRDEMIAACPADGDMAYPRNYWARLYHGTTFVLHRTSPLIPHPPAESLETCLRSVGAYIESIAEVLRTSNVPLSWMLVQGVVFAGLTMVITARTSADKLASSSGLPLLLADLPAWLRKCSVCLAIMNERLGDDLLSKLDTDFDVLADSTMRKISSELTTQTMAPGLNAEGEDSSALPSALYEPPHAAAWMSNGVPVESLDDMGHFLEILGMDNSQTYWDLFPPDMTLNDFTPSW